MAETVRTVISNCAIHGYGAADSGEWPKIRCTFDMVCSRESGSANITWDTQSWYWEHEGSIYGYKIAAAIAIDPDDPYNPRDLASDDPANELWYILEKPEDYPSENWWNYVTEYHPGPRTLSCPKDSATMYVYVKSRDDCTNNGHYCYNSPYTWTIVASYTLTLPTYETFYTVSYNANGGSGAPSAQQKSNIHDLTLSSTIPTYPLSIKYYNNADGSLSNTATVYRQFTGWNTKADGSGTSYAAGGTYKANESCTLYAQWGSATHTTLAIPDRYYTVTYNYGGGTGSPASVSLQRSEDGYATTSGGDKAYNQNATYSNITTNLNLYPRYGNATLTSLPTPTRSGYEFKGWYTDTSYSTKVTTPYTVQNNIILYAKWMALPIHQFQPNGTWNNMGPYVWRFNGTSWERVAHVYKFDGTSWKDLSV